MTTQIRSLWMCVLAVFLLVSGCSSGDTDRQQAEIGTRDSVSVAPDKLTIYYFHTNYRCWTCKQFEKLTREVLEEHYADKMADGVVDLKAVNVDNEENKHFVADYRLVTKSIVLSLEENGKELEWKNLDKIWTLVRDADRFKDYVRQGVDDYLRKIG